MQQSALLTWHCSELGRGQGGPEWKAIEAPNSRNFFNQVFFDRQIKTPTWRDDRDRRVGHGAIGCRVISRPGEPQAIKHGCTIFLTQSKTKNSIGPCHAHGHGWALRQTGDLVINRTGLATTYLQNQRTQIIEMLNRRLGVDAALEAVPSIGDEVKPSRASRDRGGPPERRLNIDISGIE